MSFGTSGIGAPEAMFPRADARDHTADATKHRTWPSSSWPLSAFFWRSRRSDWSSSRNGCELTFLVDRLPYGVAGGNAAPFPSNPRYTDAALSGGGARQP